MLLESYKDNSSEAPMKDRGLERVKRCSAYNFSFKYFPV